MTKRFVRLAQNVNMLPLQLELARAEHLWDQNTTRKTYDGTPHGAMSDIWVRFRAKDDVYTLEDHKTEHHNVFWPAWHKLPSLRPLVFGLMSTVQAVELGSILITRLPPGACILPHSDRGSWGAEWYNCKCHLTVTGQSLSWCDNESVIMQQGEVWTFDNLLQHSVENNGDVDRIAVIVSMRCEP